MPMALAADSDVNGAVDSGHRTYKDEHHKER
jgi:hypothetical protein